jgi:hypothetical protein
MLALAFDHSKAARRQDVALVHLNHPLLKHALGTFRANLWGDSFRRDQTLHRASYRVLADHDLKEPVVVAWGRLLATSELSQKLHEQLVQVGGQIHNQEVIPYSENEIGKLLEKAYSYPRISVGLGDRLRQLFVHHKRQLLEMLTAREADERVRLTALTAERAEEEASKLSDLMNDRIKELRARISSQKDKTPAEQLALFDRDEYLQFEEDMRWLERKLADLQARRKDEPTAARRRYELRNVRVFPLGLLYLLPESLVNDYE